MSAQEDDDAEISEALRQVMRSMSARVKLEQRRHQLTRLPNDRALDEALEEYSGQSDRAVWAAFVEIDKFKDVNTVFGYHNADILLRAIAALLKAMASHFPGTTVAYHAHGDEYYLVGTNETASDLHRAASLEVMLELVRKKVAELAIPVEDSHHQRPMQCTVSIGWLLFDEVVSQARPVTARLVRDCLERAVDAAKHQRNCVVRYTAEHQRRRFRSYRADCSECHAKVNVTVFAEHDKTSQKLKCPNCHADVERPPVEVDDPIVNVPEI